MVVSRTIQLFLQSIGRREEYEFYLRKFQAAGESGYFALLCPDQTTLEDGGDLLAFDLDFLLRLDLKPLLVLAGPGSNKALARLQDSDYPVEVMTPEAIVPFASGRISICHAPDQSLGGILPDIIPGTANRSHLLRAEGPLHNDAGQVIPYYYTERSEGPALAAVDEPVVALGTALLRNFPGLHVSVAAPQHLLDELFTVRGSGTVMRPGSDIRVCRKPADFNALRLRALLEDSFGRPLRTDYPLDELATAYIEADYRGAALLEAHPMDRYLSKFAVGTEARGIGLANELWDALIEQEPVLF